MSEQEKNNDIGEEAAGTAQETGEQWRDKYLRALAEHDNYRKRMEREREQMRRFALEDLLRSILTVLDHLELASRATGDVEQIREGFGLAHRDLLRILGEKGLEAIEALDQPFDPHVHEAVAAIPDPARAPGTVVDELQRGYRLNDRVLRPSRVHVTVAPPEPVEDPEGAEPNNED